ncbi:MAG: hypothetical protein LBK18_10625 [Prevotellaceae bacterium]|jgi:hypothetical protein|nr:hypothetical protein [Prevotellaceae bacterium]
MKKKLHFYRSVAAFTVVALMLATALVVSCTDEGGDTLVLPPPVVDINNPNDVQKSIGVSNGSITNGALPDASPGNINLSTSIGSTTVNSGGKLVLPILYGGASGVDQVYIQVQGADGSYYAVSPTVAASDDGYYYISISMPAGLTNGKFTFRYNVKDKSGSVSNVTSTVVEITDEVASCSNSHKEGSSGLTFATLSLGNTRGAVTIAYETYGIPDRIDVYQGERWVTGTGSDPGSPVPPMCNCNAPKPGFVSTSRVQQLQFDYEPSKGRNIIVVVSGCLGSGTAWEWQLVEAPECR